MIAKIGLLIYLICCALAVLLLTFGGFTISINGRLIVSLSAFCAAIIFWFVGRAGLYMLAKR